MNKREKKAWLNVSYIAENTKRLGYSTASVPTDDLLSLLALVREPVASVDPPPAVLDAAREVLRLAEGATKGPWSEVVWYGTDEGGWAAVGPHHTSGDDECDDDASDNHGRAEADAAFIAATRTLAVVLAEHIIKKGT